MKKFISKIKKSCRNFINGKAAFSLVELIVVIAIMAVMAAVLAPALLGYVEKSRMQKDASAMDEVSNAMTLSLADQNIYDELLVVVAPDNYSCYADGDTSTNTDANKTITKSPDLWLYNDNVRLLDETVYKPAGKMRGVTVTFKPNGKSEYILKDGIVNKIGDDSTKKGLASLAGKTLAEADFETLYNRLRSTVGDTIKVSSQTYRNSDYTIFVSMGTTGGNQADKQDAIQVYGQYNGTNLPEVATPVAGAGQSAPAGGSGGSEQPGGGSQVPTENLAHNDVIPNGGIYLRNCTLDDVTWTYETKLIPGQDFPENPNQFDVYIYGDYAYMYKGAYDAYSTHFSLIVDDYTIRGFDGYADDYSDGWCVAVVDMSKEAYGSILNAINNQPITSLRSTFCCCANLINAPVVPETVVDMGMTFMSCNSLTTPPTIPEGVTNMNSTFNWCVNLETAPTIPTNVKDIYYCFCCCEKLNGTIIIDTTKINYSTNYEMCLYETSITDVKMSDGEAHPMEAQFLATKTD